MVKCPGGGNMADCVLKVENIRKSFDKEEVLNYINK